MESRHRHSTGRLGIFAAGSRSGRQRPMHPKLIRDGTWSDAVLDLMVSVYSTTQPTCPQLCAPGAPENSAARPEGVGDSSWLNVTRLGSRHTHCSTGQVAAFPLASLQVLTLHSVPMVATALDCQSSDIRALTTLGFGDCTGTADVASNLQRCGASLLGSSYSAHQLFVFMHALMAALAGVQLQLRVRPLLCLVSGRPVSRENSRSLTT